MAYNVVDFTPSVSVDGNTPISQADDKLRTITNEMVNHVNSQAQNISDFTQAQFDAQKIQVDAKVITIENDVDNANATANAALSDTEGFQTQLDALTSGGETTYTTDALDTKLSAQYISSGTIDKQDDANVFETAVGNEYKMANTDRFVNFDGNVIDTYGPELVTNGDFSDGATGWTSYNTINEVVNGRLKITDNGASASTYMVINVVPNKTYYIDLTGYNGDTNCSVAVMNSNIAFNGGNDIVSLLNFTGTHRLYFTPTNSIIRFQIYPTSSTTGVYCYFDNISIKEITTVDMTNDIPEVMVIGWTA